jgi:uncharacterized membrane protein YkvA (DUF1232 family)
LIVRTLLSRVRLAARLVREPRVPTPTKAVPFAAALYLLWPIDLIADLLPLLGQIDDLGVVLLALELFVRWSPPAAVTFHQAAIDHGRPYSPMASGDDFIDAEWRREA